jgi:hypothetical protein
VDGPLARVLTFGLLSGIAATIAAGYQYAKGHNYSVAAQHEATTVGRIVEVAHGKSGTTYRYQFSVNGLKVDDYSEVCATALEAGACSNNGRVLVYYSYQPYSNSRLEDFAVASTDAYDNAKLALAIGLPLLVLSGTGIAIRGRRERREDGSEPDEEKGRSKTDDLPDAIHIAPEE